MRFVGTQDTFGESGDPVDLWKKYGVDADGIAAGAREALGGIS
jgi:transketolase